jgi:hypothetical protein
MASRLQDVIIRGTAAARPLSTAVAPGTLYYSTDTQTTERCADDGSAWETFKDGAAVVVQIRSITMVIDGGASVITTGLKGYLEIPFAGTIQAVTLLADVLGSIVIDIWKDTYANYPPVVGDSIVAAAKPTISAALKSQDVTLTGWTPAIAAGDILAFNVDSVATIKKLTLSLKVQAA